MFWLCTASHLTQSITMYLETIMAGVRSTTLSQLLMLVQMLQLLSYHLAVSPHGNKSIMVHIFRND